MDLPHLEPETKLLSLPVGYPRTGRDGSRRLQLLCSRRKKHEARRVQRRLGSGSSGETDRMTMTLGAAPVCLHSAPRDRLPAPIPPGVSRFLIWSYLVCIADFQFGNERCAVLTSYLAMRCRRTAPVNAPRSFSRTAEVFFNHA